MLLTSFEALRRQLEIAFAARPSTFIAIAGLSSAGKTTLCEVIAEAFPDHVRRVICDNFSRHSYVERQVRIAQAEQSGDPAALAAEENPRNWYAWDEIERALRGLRQTGGFTFDRAWNRQSGALDATYSISLPNSSLVLCDGIHLLHSPAREWFDIVMLVDTPFDVALTRGRVRGAKNPEQTAVMERLARTYNLPYFAEHSSVADWVYRL